MSAKKKKPQTAKGPKVSISTYRAAFFILFQREHSLEDSQLPDAIRRLLGRPVSEPGRGAIARHLGLDMAPPLSESEIRELDGWLINSPELSRRVAMGAGSIKGLRKQWQRGPSSTPGVTSRSTAPRTWEIAKELRTEGVKKSELASRVVARLKKRGITANPRTVRKHLEIERGASGKLIKSSKNKSKAGA